MPVVIGSGSLSDVDIDGVVFRLRGELYEDFIAGLEWAHKIGADHFSGFANRAYILLRRIESWDGVVLPDGTPAPCDMEHKLALAGKRPDLVNKLMDRAAEIEESESKN